VPQAKRDVTTPESHNRLPLFTCYVVSPRVDRYGAYVVGFICPVCRKEHSHGWAADSDPAKPQHRGAHCSNWSSPFRTGGYYIRLDSAAAPPARKARGQNRRGTKAIGSKYRTLAGKPVTAAAVRNDPDGQWQSYQFRPIRPAPETADVIGSINGVPVILVTDLGESIHSDLMREVAFKLPGDDRVHRGLMTRPGSIPRFYSGTWEAHKDSPLYASGYFLVLTLTDETWQAIKAKTFLGGIEGFVRDDRDDLFGC
jgi:hypothetical protein